MIDGEENHVSFLHWSLDKSFSKTHWQNGKLNNYLLIQISLKIHSSKRNYFVFIRPYDPVILEESHFTVRTNSRILNHFQDLLILNTKIGKDHWNVEDWRGKVEEDGNGVTIFFLCPSGIIMALKIIQLKYFWGINVDAERTSD